MKRIYTELRHIFSQYRKMDCFNLAAALSFYFILSLLPIFLIVISLVGHYVGQSADLLQKVTSLMESISPMLKGNFLQNLQNIVTQKTAFGGIGVLFLLSVVYFLFSNLERTMNRLLHSKDKRHFLLTRLLFIVFLMGLAFLLSVPSMMNFVQAILSRSGFSIDFGFALTGGVWLFVFSWVAFVMLILLIPSKKVEFKNAFMGGFIFALLIQLARWLFSLFTLGFFDRYNLIYGSLTTLILGALWIFYFSNILLLCVLWVGEQQRR